MEVDYMGYARSMGQRNPIASGLNQIGETLDQNRAFELREGAQKRQNSLADLQIQQGTASLADKQAQQDAVMGLTGAKTLKDAYAIQMKTELDKQKQAEIMKKQEYGINLFGKVATALKDGTLDEDQASIYYKSQMKLAGIDLGAEGMDITFKKQGAYYSGPVDKTTLFNVNGVPTPYTGEGIIENARIVGLDPQTKQPIYEMGKETKFKEPKADKDGYKFRSRKSGDQFIEEESQDGGKSWKPLSTAPRYKGDEGGGGGGSSSADKRDFRSWTTKLDGLVKAKAAIEKGFDPITGQLIPQTQIQTALSTVNSQIADTENYIKSEHPDSWGKYRKQAPAVKIISGNASKHMALPPQGAKRVQGKQTKDGGAVFQLKDGTYWTP